MSGRAGPSGALAAPPWSGRWASGRALLRALRLRQWTKNGVVFAVLVFGGELFEAGSLARAAAAAVLFCAASSAVYLVNDLRDVAGDRAHPTKRDRPIAAGLVRPAQAALAAAALVVLALGGAWLIGSPFLAVVAGYLALMLAYSFGLKRLAIVDVGAIAAGFVLRAVGGAAAIGAPVSPWLSLCALLLALVLGFGKRRHELSALGAAAARHRANLAAYSLPLLDRLIGAVASATVAAYAVYAVDAPNAPRDRAMLLTVPFVAFALVRYLYLLHRRGLGGAPEELLVADPPLLSCIAGWGLTSLAVLYLVR